MKLILMISIIIYLCNHVFCSQKVKVLGLLPESKIIIFQYVQYIWLNLLYFTKDILCISQLNHLHVLMDQV